MNTRKISILGTGKYLPSKTVTSQEMDTMLNVPSGWVLRKSDVHTRHYAGTETASSMGAHAAHAALEAANLTFENIDCIISASGTTEQPLPCMASLIQRAMGQGTSGIPSFDINSTCLSFVVALDVISYMIEAGRYNKVLIVSSEIASVGLNYNNKESATLFGDGAAAVIVGRSNEHSSSAILSSGMETYGDGAHLSEIRGGGTKLHAKQYAVDNAEDYLFDMDGPEIFKMTYKKMPTFVDKLLAEADSRIEDMKIVIPHQGSAMAMKLISRKLGIPKDKLMYITPDHGNTIAASIPMGLHEAIVQSRIHRGDRIMLLGTSAGLSLGGMIIDY
ncbi:3-oxoacyl-[acyl-carrier-protein] synthase-3 [Paenibacillus sp. DS2015]|uniref:beta-ketoacyl-ACP synthase III n=1 Tax=Paenibacillus sp. DS2015 TaxID=3373917 RepID=UPI003D23DBC7